MTTTDRRLSDCVLGDAVTYRNKIGLDVALEALREYRRSRRPMDDLTEAASVVRVVNVMRPYLEAVVS